jgi:FtsH-binding integral membrane protein
MFFGREDQNDILYSSSQSYRKVNEAIMFGDKNRMDSFSHDGPVATIDQIEAPARVAYLKKVYTWTLGGLFLAALAGIASAWAILHTPALQNSVMQMVVIFGGFIVAHYVCGGLVRKQSTALLGFVIANVAEGLAMGYLLLSAMMASSAVSDDPFLFIAQALGLTVLVTLSITAYVWTNPSEFRWAGAILSALALPMMVFMVLSFVVPGLFGGPIGMVLTLVFVAVSVIGLLKSTNDVMHHFSEDQVIPGAYMISMGVLVLFWNLLILIMRLQRN